MATIVVNEAFGGQASDSLYPRELLSALVESGPPRPEIAALPLTRVLREPRTPDHEGEVLLAPATTEALTGSSVGGGCR